MTTPTRPLRLAVALSLGLLPMLAGCGAARIKAAPVDRVIQANTERDFWWALRSVVQERKYPVSPSGVDESERTLTSQWKESAQPFRGGPIATGRQSYRTRVVASYQRLDPSELGGIEVSELPRGGIDVDLETYRVSIRVEQQVNNSLRPLDPRYADWKPADDAASVAREIAFALQLKLGTDEFRLQEDAERERVLRRVGR